jgi:hypothetical protein
LDYTDRNLTRKETFGCVIVHLVLGCQWHLRMINPKYKRVLIMCSTFKEQKSLVSKDSYTSNQRSGHLWTPARVPKDLGTKNSKMGAPHKNGQQRIKK